MHTSNPSQQKTLCLDILKLQCPKQLNIQKFEFMINKIDDSLQDWSIIFGVGVDHSLEIGICLGFVHLLLDIHYLFEYIVDICFDMFDGVEHNVLLLLSEYELIFTFIIVIQIPMDFYLEHRPI